VKLNFVTIQIFNLELSGYQTSGETEPSGTFLR